MREKCILKYDYCLLWEWKGRLAELVINGPQTSEGTRTVSALLPTMIGKEIQTLKHL